MLNQKNIKSTIKLAVLFLITLLLAGCATLSYSGDDYIEDNLQSIKTSEDLIFNVYKKTTDNANFKIGISKTPVPEILALYVQVENLSYETPYIFKVEDLRISNPQQELRFITTNNYLNIYHNQEASAMSAMGSVGSSISNMTGMTANMNELNQTMMQNTAQQTTQSAFSYLENIGNQISKHSIKHSSTINPRRSQYFYFFFEDLDSYPVYVKYKNLNYQFEL